MVKSSHLRFRAPHSVVVALLIVAIVSGTPLGPLSRAHSQAVADTVRSTALQSEVFKDCIKYLGGPGFPDFKGKESWANSLTVGDETALCEFGDKTLTPVSFDLGDVTSILYGQASTRHAGVWVSVGVILAPIALLGLLHKGRKHNVLISWKSSDGKEGGVFLEAKPDHFRRLLNTLSNRTGKPVLADEKDRKWLITQGVLAQLDPGGSSSTK